MKHNKRKNRVLYRFIQYMITHNINNRFKNKYIINTNKDLYNKKGYYFIDLLLKKRLIEFEYTELEYIVTFEGYRWYINNRKYY